MSSFCILHTLQASILGYACITVCMVVCRGKILHNSTYVYRIWMFKICKIGQKLYKQGIIFKSVYLRLEVMNTDLRDKCQIRQIRFNVFYTEEIFSHFGWLIHRCLIYPISSNFLFNRMQSSPN